jgi:hypothetical protein
MIGENKCDSFPALTRISRKDKIMELYLIIREDPKRFDYYVFTEILVAANNKEEALRIRPDVDPEEPDSRAWPTQITDLRCHHIGKALRGIKKGILMTSFRNG